MALCPNAHNFTWSSCPAEVLLMVFKKSDINALSNCMKVCRYWRNLVEYHCDRFNLWKGIVKLNIDDEGLTYAEKSVLESKEQFLSAETWNNIGKCQVNLRHCYKVDNIKNIGVHKDKVIILTNTDVKLFNIRNYQLIKVIDKPCIKYEETSSLVAELTQMMLRSKLNLILTNKLNGCIQIRIITSDFTLGKNTYNYIVHLDTCYEYRERVLWKHTATENGWETQSVAKYHGLHEFYNFIHIHQKKIFVLFKDGSVLVADMESRSFMKMFHFPMNDIRNNAVTDIMPSFMFHYYLFLKASENETKEMAYPGDFIEDCPLFMMHYGLSSFLQHGNTLILGYDDGKIEIYLTRRLFDSPIPKPARVFNIQSYVDKGKMESLRITALDVFEENSGHHLFVTTVSSVYELLLH